MRSGQGAQPFRVWRLRIDPDRNAIGECWRRQSGILAERRRRQTATTVAVVLAAVVLTWAFTESPAAVLLALAVGALGAPVLHTMLFRRT